MREDNSCSTAADSVQDTISPMMLWLTAVIVRVGLNLPLSLWTVATNVINLIVFWRMGVQKSALEPLLILSAADGMTGLLGSFAGVCSILKYFGEPYLVRSGTTMYVLLLVATTVANLTALVTTVSLMVARCVSVTKPFNFRSLVSARRQRRFILAFVCVLLAKLGFGFSHSHLDLQRDPATNRSQLVLIFSPEYIDRIKFADLYRCVTFFVGFVVINVCLIALVIALKRAMTFRHKALYPGSGEIPQGRGHESQSTASRAWPVGSKMSRNEVQVVKIAVTVACVFTVCALPPLVLSLLRQLVPGLTNVGCFRNSFDMILIFVELFVLLNTSVNIFIYYFLCAKYKIAFRKLFHN